MLKVNVNGISLSYERRGLGAPLVLIHGYPLDHTIWNEVAAALECTYDLIIPDMRGFGESGLGGEDCTMADLAADLACLLDHLHVKKALIAGHSMGGYVALAFARAYPDRVMGLALVSSQAQADTPEKQAGRIAEAKGIQAQGVKEVGESMSVKLTADPDLRARLKELILRQRPAALAGALKAMAFRLDSTSLLQTAKFPVLLIHGMEDAMIPVDRARQAKDLVKKGTLVEIEGSGHMPMMESPQKTAQALEMFIK